MLTCKEFLQELNDYLDETGDIELRRRIESHITQCPNCFVILDTTKKTIQVYKGVLPQTLPPDVHSRLLKAVERKSTERKLRAGLPGVQH
ncbi:MAG TPA: zf-HC2 domain-containing protein [Bryobacteraceae bacterium]|nr:zf-HC2 domain-containing protein [Bryobacteraceae bacterium]